MSNFDMIQQWHSACGIFLRGLLYRTTRSDNFNRLVREKQVMIKEQVIQRSAAKYY